MMRRAERKRLQTLFIKNPAEALKLGYASTRAKAIKGEIGEINDKQLALKQEVEEAPLTQDGLTIDLDLGQAATFSNNVHAESQVLDIDDIADASLLEGTVEDFTYLFRK